MMNTCLKWFRRFVWIGILINLSFAIPALIAPGFLNATLGLPTQAFYPWLNNAGMLLLSVSLFYLIASLDPLRWVPFAWLCVVSRLIAVVFWFVLVRTSGYPQVFTPLMYSDGAMFLILGVLLQLGLPAQYRISWGNGWAALAKFFGCVKAALALRKNQLALAIVVLVLTVFGYQAWYNLLRVVPQPQITDDEMHFKYGAIGLGVQARVPQYLFEVFPEICPDKLPGPGGYASFGLLFEGDHDVPIGFAKRQIGYPSVEPNCALCHTGAYQAAADDVPIPIPAGPAVTLDLEAFQWFLYDCASDPKFTISNLMTAIQEKHELGFFESLFYRFAILPAAKLGLNQQQKEYAWQKLRPAQGKGRTDTFNPTKLAVFGFPDDSTIGTVDFPQIWNQKPREGMWLHWDGNNDQIKERNYAAAMAVGATPDSVIPESFTRVTDWLLNKPAPAWPFAVDEEKAARGASLWQQECADCHEFGKINTGQVTTNIEVLGTDRYRLDSFTVGLVDKFHTFKKAPFDFAAYRKTQSYSNTPTDGIWARAPYLHNGSVPTLWDLLQTEEQRPPVFYKGYTVYDTEKVGFVSQGAAAQEQGFKLDTRVLGNGNSGHLFGTQLSDDEKWDLIEYMKTL